jgi:diketogulonate reductase-like aldo/keto reductase
MSRYAETPVSRRRVPIPGTRNIKRLKENALSVMVRLDDAQLERLYGILRERAVTGVGLLKAFCEADSGSTGRC